MRGLRVNITASLPAEKDFFLDEFHDTSFLFALHAADVAKETDVQELVEVCSALLTNETRVLLLIEVDDNQRDRHGVEMVVDRLSKQLALKVKDTFGALVDLCHESTADLGLLEMCLCLRSYHL